MITITGNTDILAERIASHLRIGLGWLGSRLSLRPLLSLAEISRETESKAASYWLVPRLGSDSVGVVNLR
jgi:hypothetical protein